MGVEVLPCGPRGGVAPLAEGTPQGKAVRERLRSELASLQEPTPSAGEFLFLLIVKQSETHACGTLRPSPDAGAGCGAGSSWLTPSSTKAAGNTGCRPCGSARWPLRLPRACSGRHQPVSTSSQSQSSASGGKPGPWCLCQQHRAPLSLQGLRSLAGATDSRGRPPRRSPPYPPNHWLPNGGNSGEETCFQKKSEIRSIL